MPASILFAALAAMAQQASAATPPPEGVAPHQQQGDVITPGAPRTAQPATEPAKPAARRPVRHRHRIHIRRATVARASRAAGGAIAGPAGAAVAPVLVDRAGHKVKKLVHRKKHHRKPRARV